MASATWHKEERMYGLTGSLMVLPENRQALVEALLEGARDMPGCVSYAVGEDTEDESVVWVSEVWVSRQSHSEALTLPHVREAIERARPLLVGFGARHEYDIKGGIGLEE
ncbi:MAG: antibiotic biosynthesis monooxygenase [Demequina sp.]